MTRRARVIRKVGIVGIAGLLPIVLLVLADQLRRYSFHYMHNYHNPRSLQGDRLAFYYLDWSEDLPDLKSIRACLDPDGVYSSRQDKTTKGHLRHRVVGVVQAAIGLHDQLLERPSPEVDGIFRRQLDWLLHDAMVVTPDGIPVWPEHFSAPRSGLHTCWISALSQGQAVSLLLRAAEYTGDSTYAVWAGRAVRAFTEGDLPIVWRGPDGEIFFEEYPCEPPNHVLNGCLLAWLGLWDYARYTGDPAVRSFCLRSLESIRASIPRYRIGDWTRYDVLRDRETSPTYQEIHAALAETLHGIFPDDPVWADCAQRWRRAANSPGLRTEVFFRVLFDKIRHAAAREGPTPKGKLFDGLDSSERAADATS